MTPLEDQSRTDLVKEKVDERHEMPWDLSNHSDRDLPPPLWIQQRSLGSGLIGTLSKTKTPMNWEMLNPRLKRRNKNRDQYLDNLNPRALLLHGTTNCLVNKIQHKPVPPVIGSHYTRNKKKLYAALSIWLQTPGSTPDQGNQNQ